MKITVPKRWRPVVAVLSAATLVAAIGWSAQAAVPPTPTGWSLVWADDFNGGANTLPSSANWQIDLGHSYPGGPGNWGTGEIQNYTNSTANLSLDGGGNLRITPLRDGAGNWTSARIETQRTDFKAPTGGVLRIEGRIQMPNVTGVGGARLLARLLGTRRAVPRQLLQLAVGRRVRHHGERQRHQRRLGRAALRRQPGRAVQRDQRHRHQPCLPGQQLPERVPHLPLRVGPQRQPQPVAVVCRRHAVPQRQPDPGGRRRRGTT